MKLKFFRPVCIATCLLIFMLGILLFRNVTVIFTPSKGIYTSIEPGARNIFFLETSCIFNASKARTERKLKARQACAVESAAKMNPRWTIYLLDSCWSGESEVAHVTQTRQELSYDNVRVLPLNLSTILAGTPLDSWLDNGLLSRSIWPREHASDVARLAVLWKFGGIYLDLDMVVLKPFNSLGSNFVGAASNHHVANAVMGFTHNEFGHDILDSCLEEIRMNYNGYLYTHNGPALITRVIIKKCNVTKLADITPEGCHGLIVHPEEAFYEIPYAKWRRFFNPADKGVLDLLTNRTITHLWNQYSQIKLVQVGSEQPYGVLASRHCPRVYSNCGSTF